MFATNYFKSGTRIIPFDDGSLTSINNAFVESCRYDGVRSVWKMPQYPGAWDSLPVVGYRSRKSILVDLKVAETAHAESHSASNAEELMALRNELATVDVVCGRILSAAS